MRGVEQRLDAEAIPNQQKPPRSPVVNGKGKHALQPRRHLHSQFFVEMNEHFGIGSSSKPVSLALEVGPQISVIVDLAVKDDIDRAVFVRHRLSASGREIYQRQAAVDQLTESILVMPVSIRPAVSQAGISPLMPHRVSWQGNGMKAAGE